MRVAIGRTGTIGRGGLVTGAVATVAVGAFMVWRFGWSAELPAYLVLGAVGVAASVIDIATRRIPRALIWPAYPVVAGLLAGAAATDATWWPLLRAVIAMAVLGSAYLVLALALPGQLGMGDVRLAGLLALGIGWLGWPAVASGTVMVWTLGAAVVAGMRLVVPHEQGSSLPLGPFLVLGFLFASLLA